MTNSNIPLDFHIGIPLISSCPRNLGLQRSKVPQSKDFISLRLDEALKAELQAAAELERRSLSNFGRLLLEYAWAQYLKAGSIRALIELHEQDIVERRGD
jgi:uncharacterized protein (DUF1778 family)